jgi:DNA primase
MAVLYALNRAAMQYWHQRLLESDEVLAYVESRGWPDPRALARRYGLGWAPGFGERAPSFVRHVLRKDFEGTTGRADLERALIAAGLAKRNREGRIRDHFFGRLIFPVADRGTLDQLWDAEARIAGFGGRYVPREAAPPPPEGREPPKYLNTPEGPTYPKRRLLYGLSWAAPAISRLGEAVVFEGYMDAIRVWEAGFAHSVAQCGTALTPEHIEGLVRAAGVYKEDAEACRSTQMRRWGRPLEVVLATDEDDAGRRAADRGAREVALAGYRVRIASFEGGKDPDELLKGSGPGGTALFQGVLDAAATPAVAYLARQGRAEEAPWGTSLRGLVGTLRNLQHRGGGGGGEEERLRDATALSARLLGEGSLPITADNLLDLFRRTPEPSRAPRDAEVGQ